MQYASMREAVLDLERTGQLVRIEQEVDPYLEMAEIHRRVQEAGGPAIYFARVKGSPFPAVSNLFGTLERARFLFRGTLSGVKALIEAKADPASVLKHPGRLLSVPKTGIRTLPLKRKTGPVLEGETTVSKLPQIHSWPKDGGAFVLLPQVMSEDPVKPGILSSNMGMYRVQLSGNDYTETEVGLHYQIRRDIGIHHTRAVEAGKVLPASVFVGGPPAHTLAAVMPLPEGLSEVVFAGALSGRNFRYARRHGNLVSLDADFCITGTIAKDKKPEGPFGDHIGYYSLTHDFPYLENVRVYHRKDAIWPFTVVGRPPAEDTIFGQLIHEITHPMVPISLPGVKAVHAVDAAGVHPLLLAIGHERFIPGDRGKPRELLTQANAILGFGHCSLAKYLFILAEEDAPHLDVANVEGVFTHILERLDPGRDLHFQTKTTIDTLDYTGGALNEGSKLVVAACGEPVRSLSYEMPKALDLPNLVGKAGVVMPGILAVTGVPYEDDGEASAREMANALGKSGACEGFPLVILADDADFVARSIANFLWVTFTRSDPARDLHGACEAFTHKHWGCELPILIDARTKPWHAPGLEKDPAVARKVADMAAGNGPLSGLF